MYIRTQRALAVGVSAVRAAKHIMLIDDKISTLQSAQNKGFEIRTPMEIGMFKVYAPEKEGIYF